MPSLRVEIRKVLVEVLRSFYRYLVSPIVHLLCGPGFGCRFVPTCSEYTAEAYLHFGGMKATLLSLHRISRCHPFARAGYDPLPHAIGQRVIPSLNKVNQSDPGRYPHGP